MKEGYKINVLTVTAGSGTGPVKTCMGGLHRNESVTTTKVSKHRKTGTSMPIKVTDVAFAVDQITDKAVSVLKGRDSVIVENNGVFGLVYATQQHWTGQPTKLQVLLADLIYSYHHEENDELRTVFADIVKHAGKQKELTEDVLLCCDSYYYFNGGKQVTVDDALIEETLAAAYRKREYVDSPLTDMFGLGQTTLATKTPVDEMEEPEVEKDSVDDFLQQCKEGAYRIPYKWNEEQAEYIYSPSLLDTFVPTETFVNVMKKIRFRTNRILQRMEQGADRITALGSDYINLTLTGKPGTGKTAMVYAISAATGLPVYTTAGSHNTDEDEFEGKTKMVDGKPTAVPTDALKCFEDGGIFLIEEANLPQAAVIMGALGQAVEFPFILKKNGYETIRRHPLCIFVTTMNVGTVGAKAMSQPFANRFKQSYVLNDPDKEVFINILKNRTGESHDLCRWVYNAYESVLRCLDKNDGMSDVESIKLALSMRSCIGAIENIQEGQSPKEAVRDSIIGKIAEQDLELSEVCWRAVDAVPNYRRKKK